MEPRRPRENSDETQQLLSLAAKGDQRAWASLVNRYRQRLQTMLMLRVDPRLERRFDAADVLQEVYLEAFKHLPDYLHSSRLPFYLWLRGVASNKLASLYRHHVGVKARASGREVPLFQGSTPLASSFVLASQLIGREPRPSEKVRKAEQMSYLQQALNQMDPLDREVLALRHFEDLTNGETALVLGLTPSGASRRYASAALKLKDMLTRLPGGKEMWE
jgi:RNA polymerase sigma-70 factor (ECF subfamily)